MNKFIIHHVELREGQWRISYEQPGEWRPRTVNLKELLEDLANAK